jgi:hypothetical protein
MQLFLSFKELDSPGVTDEEAGGAELLVVLVEVIVDVASVVVGTETDVDVDVDFEVDEVEVEEGLGVLDVLDVLLLGGLEPLIAPTYTFMLYV